MAFPFGAHAGSLALGAANATSLLPNAPENLANRPIDRRVDSLSDLDQASFEGQLNSHFQLLKGDALQSMQLKLTEIFDFKAANGNSATVALTQESFSLIFHGTENSLLAQNVYTLRHPQLGEFSLLLVPRHADGHSYEAVINRLHA